MPERFAVGDVVAVPSYLRGDYEYNVARVVDVQSIHYPSPHVGAKTLVTVTYADGQTLRQLDNLQHAAAIRIFPEAWTSNTRLTRAEAEGLRLTAPQYGHTL